MNHVNYRMIPLQQLNRNNFMKLKVGDKVIALNNPATELSQPRIKGNLYIVASATVKVP